MPLTLIFLICKMGVMLAIPGGWVAEGINAVMPRNKLLASMCYLECVWVGVVLAPAWAKKMSKELL